LRLGGNQFGRDAVASLIKAVQQQQHHHHQRRRSRGEDQAEPSKRAHDARSALRICDVGAAVGGEALLAALR
jgi:2-polyprenyl-3-methyl-5-hydroxy-6-metoxy-1,4-benzoquinol methylase